MRRPASAVEKELAQLGDFSSAVTNSTQGIRKEPYSEAIQDTTSSGSNTQQTNPNYTSDMSNLGFTSDNIKTISESKVFIESIRENLNEHKENTKEQINELKELIKENSKELKGCIKWKTLWKILTGIAGIITAIAAIVTVLAYCGITLEKIRDLLK